MTLGPCDKILTQNLHHPRAALGQQNTGVLHRGNDKSPVNVQRCEGEELNVTGGQIERIQLPFLFLFLAI